MPETLLQKETLENAVREAGQAVATAGTRVKDGIASNRQEMMILAATLVFVVAMALVGALLISVG